MLQIRRIVVDLPEDRIDREPDGPEFVPTMLPKTLHASFGAIIHPVSATTIIFGVPLSQGVLRAILGEAGIFLPLAEFSATA